MPVTELLVRNRELYGDEVALVELNPELADSRRTTWKEYDLIQSTSRTAYRREITWRVFDERPTALPTAFSSAASRRATRSPF